MVNCDRFYINGEWISPERAELMDVVNPATEQSVTKVALGTEADVDAAVEAAANAFESFSKTTVKERSELLDAIVSAYQARLPELSEAVTIEMGAPLWLSTNAQVPMGLSHFKVAREVIDDYEFEEKLGTTLVMRDPIGVCAMITPWNWPLHQIGCKVAPAIATGCTMVLKPSEIAPLSAQIFAEIMHDAGTPAGVFNLVHGEGPKVGRALSSHDKVDMVSITGSTRAGADVSVAAAPTIKRVVQELGGKSANILLDDVDLEAAVTAGAVSAFLNTGQSCALPARMLVPASREAEAVEIAKKVADGTPVGDPFDRDTKVGPIISQTQYDRVRSLIERGIEEGATLSAGGLGKADGLGTGYFAKPTIFSNVNNDMDIAQTEIFGPVLVIIPYQDDADAVRIANESEYGLSGFVQSSNLDRAKVVARQLRTGQIRLNGAGLDPYSPFGGYKKSGNGREFGKFGFDEFVEIKAINGYFEAA